MVFAATLTCLKGSFSKVPHLLATTLPTNWLQSDQVCGVGVTERRQPRKWHSSHCLPASSWMLLEGVQKLIYGNTHMKYAETCLINEEDRHHSSEYFFTEPGEVVDKKCQLGESQNQQNHHYPHTRHGSPLQVGDVQHVGKL